MRILKATTILFLSLMSLSARAESPKGTNHGGGGDPLVVHQFLPLARFIVDEVRVPQRTDNLGLKPSHIEAMVRAYDLIASSLNGKEPLIVFLAGDDIDCYGSAKLGCVGENGRIQLARNPWINDQLAITQKVVLVAIEFLRLAGSSDSYRQAEVIADRLKYRLVLEDGVIRLVPRFTPVCRRSPFMVRVLEKRFGRLCHTISVDDLAEVSSLSFHTSDNKGSFICNRPRASDFDGFSALRRLSLRQCGISKISGDLFDQLTSLVYLDLSDNDLDVVPRRAFAALGSLVELHLNRNRLKRLRADTLAGLTSLRYLFLTSNHIEEIKSDAFSESRDLEYLWLQDNRFSILSRDIFAPLPALANLRIPEDTIIPDMPVVRSSWTNRGESFVATPIVTTLGEMEFAGERIERLRLAVPRVEDHNNCRVTGTVSAETQDETISVSVDLLGRFVSAHSIAIDGRRLIRVDFVGKVSGCRTAALRWETR